MIFYKAYKYRICPNGKQIKQIQDNFNAVRFVFNKTLEYKIKEYETENRNSPSSEIRKVLTNEWKKEFDWLKKSDSRSLYYAIEDVFTAYENFFNKSRKDGGAGFPKFKSKKKSRKSFSIYNQDGRFEIRRESSSILLPKLDFLKIKLDKRQIKGRIIKATISQTKSGKYFISLLVEENIEPLPVVDKMIGFDLGVKEFLIDSEGNKIDNPKLFKKSQKKIAKLQRRLAHKQKDSKNREKARVKLAKAHEKLHNQRQHFLHNISRKLINENQVIISEDLSVKDMLENNDKRLTREIQNLALYEFTRQLEYKAKWTGRVYIKIDRYFPSSQMCSECGFKKSEVKNLNVREWVCSQCGVHHDRDTNAAKNILKEGLRLLNKQ